MSVLAVKEYVAAQLALLDVPVLASVWSQRPKQVTVGEQTVVIVTCPQSRERRLTGARARQGAPTSGGLKQIEHTIRLDVYWIAADEQAGGRWFDTLLDLLDQTYRAVTLPAALTDAETGGQSSISVLGEQIDTQREEPQLDESAEGVVAFTATKTLQVTEYVQG